MSTNLPYRRVETFSDDAITVRLQRRNQKLVGVIDFPSFCSEIAFAWPAQGFHVSLAVNAVRVITRAPLL